MASPRETSPPSALFPSVARSVMCRHRALSRCTFSDSARQRLAEMSTRGGGTSKPEEKKIQKIKKHCTQEAGNPFNPENQPECRQNLVHDRRKIRAARRLGRLTGSIRGILMTSG